MCACTVMLLLKGRAWRGCSDDAIMMQQEWTELRTATLSTSTGAREEQTAIALTWSPPSSCFTVQVRFSDASHHQIGLELSNGARWPGGTALA